MTLKLYLSFITLFSSKLLFPKSEIDFLYDIAGCSHSNWPEINEYLADKPNARKALRIAMHKNVSEKELYNSIINSKNNQFNEEELEP